MLTRSGEKVVRQQNNTRVEFEISESGSKAGAAKGNLCLTNQRVVFEVVSGLFNKKTTTLIDCPISRIVNVGVEGLFGKKLVLEMPLKLTAESQMQSMAAAMIGEVQCKAYFGVDEPQQWENAVRQTIAG